MDGHSCLPPSAPNRERSKTRTRLKTSLALFALSGKFRAENGLVLLASRKHHHLQSILEAPCG
jgi:hypothetical protein